MFLSFTAIVQQPHYLYCTGLYQTESFVGNTQELKTGLKTHQNLSGFAVFTQVGRAKNWRGGA
jgi:hypothetical protein